MGYNVRVKDIGVFFIPISTRMMLVFGKQTLTSVTCLRVRIEIENEKGASASGWGEVPLNIQWLWPSSLCYEKRMDLVKEIVFNLADSLVGSEQTGHAVDLGNYILETLVPDVTREQHNHREKREYIPWLAALAAASAFDIAVHDAYGNLHNTPVYNTYNAEFMSHDLSFYFHGYQDGARFRGKYPEDYLLRPSSVRLTAWHLVGGKDPLEPEELTGDEPDDGYPVLLKDWIRKDGLRCLKVKLLGADPEWDYNRVVRVGCIAAEEGVYWLSVDFNCTVREPGYVVELLDRLMVECPRIYGMLLYVEQPFPYDFTHYPIDVHAVSARKPLFMDESSFQWRNVPRGIQLGWSGIALKTCKTQTGSLFSACLAKEYCLPVMVQDLTNPMLAQIPHLLLAAHVGTYMGVETNSMQFYPEASKPEASVHPGIYQRKGGFVHLSSLTGPGFGYRIDEINRELPPRAEKMVDNKSLSIKLQAGK
ncbi:MAG: enolase C-terminal domain-like protein [Spirochaetota bacterium]